MMDASIKSLLRTAAILGLSAVAFVCLLSEPADNSATWMADFFIVKGIGFGAVYAAYRLFGRWSKADTGSK